MSDLIKFLESIRDEIDEYVEYLVDVEGVELSNYQQKKLSEPLDFQILKLKTDNISERLSHD